MYISRIISIIPSEEYDITPPPVMLMTGIRPFTTIYQQPFIT
jgi:hypothetical protein